MPVVNHTMRPDSVAVVSAPAPSLDRLTVTAIAIAAYGLANIIHEGFGHGGACLLVAGRAVTLNAIFFQCADDGLGPNAMRIIPAAGRVANLIAAAVLGAMRRVSGRWPSTVRYFLWLLLAINILQAFGYLLFSGIGGFGDWAAVIANLPGTYVLRVAETALGGVLYFIVAPRLLWVGLVPFLGADQRARVTQARALTVQPYVVGGVTYVAAALFNPYGIKLVLLSAAAASFGGTSLLAWCFTQRATRREVGEPTATALGIPRSAAWIAIAAAMLALFVGVLGPGFSF